MNRLKYTLLAIVITGGTVSLAPAHAEIPVGKKSTWELCKNLEPGSSVSASLRDQSEDELRKRGAECSFLEDIKTTEIQQKVRPGYKFELNIGDEPTRPLGGMSNRDAELLTRPR